MQVETRNQPSFAVARCVLGPQERVRVESGAMYAMSPGMRLDAKVEGGLFKGLKRAVAGGESLFITTYTAPPDGGWVDVAANLPGDVATVEITPDRPFHVTRGSWIAGGGEVEIETKWAGMKSLAGGEGGFVLRTVGEGLVVLGCYGALDVVDLAPGEAITVDTGHVVAYDASVEFAIRRAVEGKSIQSMKTGEGFVFDFAGPGRLYLQSRNPKALVEWLTRELPFQR